MASKMNPNDALEIFAATISKQPIGLASHEPELGADIRQCFMNVQRKVEKDGGKSCYGWFFNDRVNPEKGAYLMATHHAVWRTKEGYLIDVTPFHPEEKHHPFCPRQGYILFQVDDTAKPVEIRRGGTTIFAPLPIRFYPLDDDPALVEYVETLAKAEREKVEAIYKNPFKHVSG